MARLSSFPGRWTLGTGSCVPRVPCALPSPPQVPGKYTVTGLDEKGGPDALVLRSGDEVELVQEGDEGLW